YGQHQAEQRPEDHRQPERKQFCTEIDESACDRTEEERENPFAPYLRAIRPREGLAKPGHGRFIGRHAVSSPAGTDGSLLFLHKGVACCARKLRNSAEPGVYIQRLQSPTNA